MHKTIDIIVIFSVYVTCILFTFGLFRRVIGANRWQPYIAFGLAFSVVLFRRLWLIMIWPDGDHMNGHFNNAVMPALISCCFLAGIAWFDELAKRTQEEMNKIRDMEDHEERAALLEKLNKINEGLRKIGGE